MYVCNTPRLLIHHDSHTYHIKIDAERLATEEAMHSQQKSKSALPLDATARSSRSRMKLKDPLDMANPRYLEVLKSRQLTAGDMDYLNDNIVSTMGDIDDLSGV